MFRLRRCSALAEALQLHVASFFKLSDESHVLAAVGDFAFRHLVVQVDGTFLASHHFVYNYEVAVVYEEYGTAVFQVLVARILGNQYLYVAFRLPQLGYGFGLVEILVVQRYGVVYAGLTVPVALFHHFALAGIYIRTGIGEQVFAVEHLNWLWSRMKDMVADLRQTLKGGDAA